MNTFRFTEAPPALLAIDAKFGGQPNWLGEPMWPISRSTRRPMQFICQVPVPTGFAGRQEVAYVFVSGRDQHVDRSWEPRGGENAVILQPGPFRAVVPTIPITIGPCLQRFVDIDGRRELEDVEYLAEAVDLASLGVDLHRATTQYLGKPNWIQCDDTPAGGPWRFLLQIDSATDRYRLNFGDAGVAYVFVAEDGTAARFLWQCY